MSQASSSAYENSATPQSEDYASTPSDDSLLSKHELKAEASDSDPPEAKPAAFDWGGLGLNLKNSKPASGRMTELRQIQYQRRGATDDHESHANQSAVEADRPLTGWKGVQH